MPQEAPQQTGPLTPADSGPHPRRSQPAAGPTAAPPTEVPTLQSYLWAIAQGTWIVVGTVAAFFVAAILYIIVTPPTYLSDVLVQVEENVRTLAGLQELTTMLSEKSLAETELAVIRSRSAVGKVVDELHLDVVAAPHRFPIIGHRIARWYRGKGPAEPLIGLSRFAWGGEQISLVRLDVSDELRGKDLVLTALGNDRYRVDDAKRSIRFEGVVGTVASFAKGEQRVEMLVSKLVARPGTEFDIVREPRSSVVASLQKALRITEEPKKSGILVISLEGSDPFRVVAILDAIANTYVRQNVDRKSAEASKTLEFIESQLPIVKTNLEEAQAALNEHRSKNGSVDISMETQSVVNRSVEVDRAIQELEMQRAELRQRFTPNHPLLLSAEDKERRLRYERAAMAARLRGIPAAEAESARLTRDLRSATALYELLFNKAQELRVVKSGTVGNVRIIDRPVVPDKPESPKARLVLALAIVLGLAGGFAGAVLRKVLSAAAHDADEIEAGTGLAVYAIIPHSSRQIALSGEAPDGIPGILAAADPGDIAVENLRSLRTSLQFALAEAGSNVVVIGGPSPDLGKSFVCMNLAWVLATPDHRVLLIDGDLRRGHLHRSFGIDRRPGVSEVLVGAAEPAAAVRSTPNENLDVLSTGRIPPNPAEMLGSKRFEQLIRWASASYAVVIIDTPPILAVADSAVVARHGGVNILVLRSGRQSINEIALAAKRFNRSGINVHGAVLNDVRFVRGRYGKYGSYRRYEYRSETTALR